MLRSSLRSGWCTGSYLPQTSGTTTGHIGRRARPNPPFHYRFSDLYPFFRDLLEAEGGFAAQGKTAGNEQLLWHGTVRACHLGEPGEQSFCTDQECSLCSIARGSFDLEYANTSVWQRYGPGIYTSTKSSKSAWFFTLAASDSLFLNGF